MPTASTPDAAARAAVMAREREALRQQMMLRALLRDARPGVLAGWMRGPLRSAAAGSADPTRFERGLAAYQANAGAMAERALAAAYPVLQQLLSAESFAGLARSHWRQQPPERGDLAQWGAALPAFVAAAESLREEDYLVDVAALEWLLHRAAMAADAPAARADAFSDSLATWAAAAQQADPAQLRLELVAGAAVLASPHPIVSIWEAHQGERAQRPEDERFAAVREAFAAGRGEIAFVCREGLQPTVRRVDAAEARFLAALLAGRHLGAALLDAEDGFDFAAWLARALQGGWIAALHHDSTGTPTA